MMFHNRLQYVYMEEVLGNVPAARQIFERWMEWEPDEQAWLSYIKMELRYKEVFFFSFFLSFLFVISCVTSCIDLVT